MDRIVFVDDYDYEIQVNKKSKNIIINELDNILNSDQIFIKNNMRPLSKKEAQWFNQ